MSIWIAGVPILGTAQKCVVMPPVSVPMKQTRSARFTTRFALSREYEPTTPTASGCVPGIESFPFSEVATGICSASANATSSAPACDDHRPRGLLQRLDRGAHARVIGGRAERRHARELRLDERLELGLVLIDLAFVAAELQVHRSGRAGHRRAK